MNMTSDHPDPAADAPTSRGWLNRFGQIDLGAVPVIIGLIVIWIIFQIANDHFLTPLNLTNLLLQITSVGIISTGIVLVLLLGEIDLSVGAISGFAGSVMAVMNVKNGVPGPIAVLAGVATGLLIGLIQGWWVSKLRVPSFVVTLAGWLAWQGAQLFTLGTTGTINLRDPFILGLTLTFFPHIVGWIIGIAFWGGYVAVLFEERHRRLRAGLAVQSIRALVFRSVVIAIPVLGAIAVFNADRGLPSSVVFLVGLIAVFDLICRRTLLGRHIYAVGGNPEAARRATIPVDRIRIIVFMISSALAAFGGVMAGSRLLAVNQSSGSGDVLLNAIAAAVIGGTSLFGGRGNTWSVLLGALVIGSISNGMDLLALASPIKFMITGGVLLLAVTIDALSRRRREAAGR
jgi:D-xylose transport system permease protein